MLDLLNKFRKEASQSETTIWSLFAQVKIEQASVFEQN